MVASKHEKMGAEVKDILQTSKTIEYPDFQIVVSPIEVSDAGSA